MSSRRCCRSPGPSTSSPSTASTGTWWPTPSSPSLMGVPSSHVHPVRGRRRRSRCPTRGLELSGRVPAGYLYVDGIVGDVGRGVLRDRRVLAEEGVVVVVATVDVGRQQGPHRPGDHHQGLGLRPRGRGPARRGLRPGGRGRGGFAGKGVRDVESLEREVRRAAGQFVSERTQAPADDRARRDGGVSGRAAVMPERSRAPLVR